MSKQIKVALIGNPNTGKTSIFNSLTGLNQKTANYPGVTVEKKEGVCKLDRGVKAHIYDLPGTYSLNASSIDEITTPLDFNSSDKLVEIILVPTCIRPFSFFTSSTRFERKSGNFVYR